MMVPIRRPNIVCATNQQSRYHTSIHMIYLQTYRYARPCATIQTLRDETPGTHSSTWLQVRPPLIIRVVIPPPHDFIPHAEQRCVFPRWTPRSPETARSTRQALTLLSRCRTCRPALLCCPSIEYGTIPSEPHKTKDWLGRGQFNWEKAKSRSNETFFRSLVR